MRTRTASLLADGGGFACPAASIISSSRRSSRRIQRPCLGQDRVLQSPVERGGRDQVDGAAEDGGELVGELLDLPAEPAARLQLVEHVDVAVRVAVPQATEPKTSSGAIP